MTQATARPGRGRSDWTLLYHTILAGVSSLVPVPFVDDMMAVYFRRRLVWRLAKNHGRELSPQELRELGQERGFGCSSGCLTVVGYVFQEIVQTFLPWLKWQRSIDLATETYYSGYLWDLLLGSESFDAAHAKSYGKAVQRARNGTNTALIKNLIQGSFRSSAGLVRDISRSLLRFWGYYIKQSLRLFQRRERAADGQDPEERQPGIRALIEEVAGNLMERLGAVPQAHYDRLEERLRQELEREGLRL